MCTVCGCAEGETTIGEGHAHHHHDHGHGHDHAHHHHHDGRDDVHGHVHSHGHGHGHAADGSLNFGSGPAGVHVTGQSQTRLIEIETDILAKNDAIAAVNRRRLEAEGIVAVNLLSSPGSGKTTLLVEALAHLRERMPVAVIEGDQHTSNDAARIRATGVPAIQINTGKGCHLDAEMIASALDHIALPRSGVLFIENVGNLVCPAAFDLGETRRAVLASATEGEDKPLKYPQIFAGADAVILSKMDLVPYLDIDIGALIENARKVAPRIDVLKTSAKKEPGIGAFLAWIEGLRAQHAPPHLHLAAE